MSRGFRQFRYYGENSGNIPGTDYPVSNIDIESLIAVTGSNSICGRINGANIMHLGIQSLPGCKFFLNGKAYATYIGNSGIFELDFEGTGQAISSICFDETWIRNIFSNAANSQTPYIIVDIAYDTSGLNQQQLLEEEEDVHA